MVGIGINLARGRKPDCHCFGRPDSSPAGWKTLVRNGVLAAVAGFILSGGPRRRRTDALNWLGALPGAQLLALLEAGLLILALLVSQVAQWWFVFRLVSQNGRLLVRLEALELGLGAGGVAPSQNGAQQAQGLLVGTEAPTFSLEGLYGETITLDALRASGKPVMLLFSDPECGPCTALMPEIGRWQEDHSEKLTTALISRGDPGENRTKSSEHGLTNVLLQKDWEVSGDYQINGTPSAVLVGLDGKVASPVVAGPEAIQSLVAWAVSAPAPQLPVHPQQAAQQAVPAGPKVGDPAPPLKLRDLSGKKINLATSFKGREDAGSLLEPGVRLLPADVRRPEGTGRPAHPRGRRSSCSSPPVQKRPTGLWVCARRWCSTRISASGRLLGRAVHHLRCSSMRRARWPPSWRWSTGGSRPRGG